MIEQEFGSPQEALAHFGVKGMKWGVVKKDPSGGTKKSPPPETSVEKLKAESDSFYAKQDPKKLQTEGQKKLQAQANKTFPEKSGAKAKKREMKAVTVDRQANKIDREIQKLSARRDALRPTQRFLKKNLNDRIDVATKNRDSLQKKAQQIRDGKLTTDQKLVIGVGAAVVVGGILLYSAGKNQSSSTFNPLDSSTWDTGPALFGKGLHSDKTVESLHGPNQGRKAALLERNRQATADQWRTLFGNENAPSLSGESDIGAGSFYSGLTNKKAYDRPEFTIPKETTFQRLSNHQEDSSSYTKGAYSTFLNNDKKIYGASSEFGDKNWTLEFTPKHEVRVPRLQTVLAHLKQVADGQLPQGATKHTDEAIVKMYHNMAGGSWADNRSQMLFDSLRSHGYSAIVDDMDAGYLGDLPVVFFGDANPAKAIDRTIKEILEDSASVLKLSRQYA